MTYTTLEYLAQHWNYSLVTYEENLSTYFYSDIHILDASYIRLNNISLAYHLPKSLCRSLYMQSARVQANVENPFFWAKTKQAKYQLGGYNATNYVLGIYLNF